MRNTFYEVLQTVAMQVVCAAGFCLFVLMSFDALEYELTGSCDDCLIINYGE